MSETGTEQAHTVEIPASAGLQEAVELADTLKALEPSTPLVFDASNVEAISTPYILTIVSALKSRADIQPPAQVAKPANAFLDGFSDLGLFQDLMKMEFLT